MILRTAQDAQDKSEIDRIFFWGNWHKSPSEEIGQIGVWAML